MARQPQPPQPTRWTIYYAGAKARYLGEVEADDEAEAEAIAKAAEEFKQPATKLMAVKRR
jgi:hypothetical protein